MEYKKIDCTSYNIHTIKTDKFKTVRMEVLFSQSVKKENMPIYTFLSDLLTDTMKFYPRRKDIAIRLEELYKAAFYGITNKVGNLFTVSFIIEFISSTFINEDNYLKEVLAFPFEAILKPNVKNKEFALVPFNIVKRRIIQDIEAIKENADKLAITNALEKMTPSSPSSYKVLGEISDIENITPASLYKAYEELFQNFNCDIFIIGNLNMEEAVQIIKDKFHCHVIKKERPKLIAKNTMRKKAQEVCESSSFVQSSLVMIYNINNLAKELKDVAFHLFNFILGSGGISSKLYRTLRTDNSLCYGVRSLYLKYDELLVVEVSLDDSNVELAKKLIRKAIKDMITGNFTEEELEDAKKNIIFALKNGLDNNATILNNYIFKDFDGLPLLEDRIKLVEKITKEDILKCGASLSINTVYVQRAGVK